MPRQKHLKAALHIMCYQKLMHYSRLVFNPYYPNIDHSTFQEYDWTYFYEDAVEAIPPNAPLLKGKKMNQFMFIESNHAGNKWTRRSRTRFMVYMNIPPINWYSKNSL